MDWTVISVLFVTFTALLLAGVPIIFVIGLSTLVTLTVSMTFSQGIFIVAQRIATGMDSFALLAIPFFVLAGNIMNTGGLALRLVNFAKVLGGWLPGSLAHCTVIANMMFGSLSGSAVAAGAAIGGVMTPMANKEGYDPAFTTAVNITSCPTGLLIPPSNAFIIFSMISGGTSVAALFLAGYVPGLLMGLGVMAVAYLYAKKRNYPVSPRAPWSEIVHTTLAALPSLGLIVVIMGGILSGWFTPTEASAIAVVYTMFLTLICYRELGLRDLPGIFLDSALTSCIVLVLIGASNGMAFALSHADIPYMISDALLNLSDNKYVILVIINAVLLVVGTFMDMTPALLIFTPIFLPVIRELGVDVVHFGVFMVFNLCIGLCTPPVGSAIFVACSVAKIRVNSVLKTLLPFYVALFVALFLVTYIPDISLFLPRLVLGWK